MHEGNAPLLRWLDYLPRVERMLRVLAWAGTQWPEGTVRQNLMQVVHLRTLAEEAASEGGELHGLWVPSVCGLQDAPATRSEIEAQIAFVLDAHEQDIDALLLNGPIQWRALEAARNNARSRGADDEQILRIERQLASVNLSPFLQVRHAARVIAETVEPVRGIHAANAWEERVSRALFPVVYQTESTDRLYDWLTDEANLDAEVLAGVDNVYDEFVAKRRVLRDRIINAEFELRAAGSTPGYSTNPTLRNRTERLGRLHDQYEALSLERIELAAATNRLLRNVIEPDVQPLFDEQLRRIGGFSDFPSHFPPP